jgi:hypothetical protein
VALVVSHFLILKTVRSDRHNRDLLASLHFTPLILSNDTVLSLAVNTNQKDIIIEKADLPAGISSDKLLS